MTRLRSLLRSPLGAGFTGGLVALAFGIAVVAAGLVDVDADDGATTTTVAQAPLASDAEPASSRGASTPGDVYEEHGGGVAFIAAGGDGPGGMGGTGSGVLIDDDGHVLTNAHVVDGADSVTVKFGDGDALDAEVLGADDSTDIAVLEVDPGEVDAEPLDLGDSGAVEVGDPVVAIGNPYGLDRTVTSGIVSALQRQISAPNGFTISDVIQTDAAINPGNSGGPLIDGSGRVIGINSQIATGGSSTGSVGIGFAVPSNTASDVAGQIIDGGTVEHAYLGVEGGDPRDREGALIGRVTSGGPADEAGLSDGDLVVAIDGREISGMDDLIAAINEKDPGDTVALEVLRDGDETEVQVELGERPENVG